MQDIQKLLEATAAHYVATRAPSTAISTADGLRVLRAVVPQSMQTDGELVNLIAQAAIVQRRQVLFEDEITKDVRFLRAGLSI